MSTDQSSRPTASGGTPREDSVCPEVPLPTYKINPTSIVMIDGEPYKPCGETLPGRIHLMHMVTGAPYIRIDEDGRLGLLTHAGWDDLLLASRLRVIEPPSRITARQIARMTDWDYRDIVGDPKRKPVAGDDLPLDPYAAKMMAEVILLDEHGVPNGIIAMRKALAKHWPGYFEDKFGPHDKPETIKRWRSERGTPGNRLLVDFVRMWGRVPRRRSTDGVVEEITQKMCLRARIEPGKVTEIEDEISTLIAQINAGEHNEYAKPTKAYVAPKYSKIWRAWTALDQAFSASARDGVNAMRADWRGSGKPLTAKRPLQLGIIDHTRIPAVAVIDMDYDILYEEVWLTTLFDVCSRVALARVLTAFPPSLWTVGEVIRRANLPKRPPPAMAARYPGLRRLCGRTAELVVDNGREFRGHGFEDAAGQAGFSVRFAPIKKPTYRAVGERYFRTIKEKIAARVPGRTFPFPKSNKSEHDPRLTACLLLDDLEALLNQGEAEYHTEIHEAHGMQPALFFHKKTGGVIDVAHDLSAFLNEIGEIEPKVQIDRAGVTLFGMRYAHPTRVPELLDDLIPVEPRRQSKRADGTRTATSKVKYNRMDISHIHVWNRVTRKYVKLECEFADYTNGLPLELDKQVEKQAAHEAASFNTEAERKAARSRRVQAIRAIDRTADAEQRNELAKLLDIPRIRQITGNIVETNIAPAYPVSIGDFIPHDVAATTSLDDEIMSPRKSVADEGSRRKRRIPARDRRDAGKPRKSPPGRSTNPAGADFPAQRAVGSSRRITGDYE